MKDVAIATMTFDRKGNAELMESALEVLSQLPYEVYVSDGGSSERFVENMRKMGFHVNHAEGLTFQHKDAILRASDSHSTVLYTEPDKYDWFLEGLERAIEMHSDEKSLGVIARTPRGFKTFPEHQQLWEGRLNKIISGNTGVKGDYIYGPKIFPVSLGYEFGKVNEDLGWGGMMFLVGRAYNLGLPIKMIYTASDCPLDQRNEDNENYRKRQFGGNVKGFNMGLK